MSNLPTVSITHQFDGDAAARSAVSASQLDVQLGNLAANQNAQKAVIDSITDASNGLAQNSVGIAQLKAEALSQITTLDGAVAIAPAMIPVVQSTSITAARSNIGISAAMDAVVTAATSSAGRDALGMVAMNPVVSAISLDAARTAMGPFDEADLSLTDVATNDASAAKHGFMKKLPGTASTVFHGDGTFSADLGTYLLESRDTAAPNATVPVHALTATGAEGNIDVAIVPKGNGAITADIPDNSTAGGNKRGAYAVDLQAAPRSSAANVASGAYSGILAGSDNKITGSYSGVLSGSGNALTADSSAACASTGATIAHAQCFAHGNSAVSKYANSRIHGATSKAQGEDYIAFNTTTDAMATPLLCAGSVIYAVPMPTDDDAVMISAEVVGYKRGAAEAGGYVIEACARRGTGAGTVAIVGAAVVRSYEDTAAWNVTVTADTANGGIKINVIGVAATTIDWFAWIRVARRNRTP